MQSTSVHTLFQALLQKSGFSRLTQVRLSFANIWRWPFILALTSRTLPNPEPSPLPFCHLISGYNCLHPSFQV